MREAGVAGAGEALPQPLIDGLRVTNTTLDTSLLCLVVLAYCLRLLGSSQSQTYGLLDGVSASKAWAGLHALSRI